MDENPKSEDMMICKSLLRDVTNVDKMRRKSAHKEAVEKTASPNFCTKELKKSLEGKENDEVCIVKINFKFGFMYLLHILMFNLCEINRIDIMSSFSVD